MIVYVNLSLLITTITNHKSQASLYLNLNPISRPRVSAVPSDNKQPVALIPRKFNPNLFRVNYIYIIV